METPTRSNSADCAAAATADLPLETDALIIGAGPVGLFQAFQLGLHDIHAHIVDALPYAGGQCMELYPDKPIYDIPGLPVCTGRELVDRLLQQVRPFKPAFHFKQLIDSIERQADGRLKIGTNKGQQFLAKTVLIAAGVGAFVPRKLVLEGIERFEDQSLHYEPPNTDALQSPHVVVIGDSDSALRTAITLAKEAPTSAPQPRVTVLHRRDSFSASADTIATFRQCCEEGTAQFIVGQVTGFIEMTGKLTGLRIAKQDGIAQELNCGSVAVYLGLSPKLGPVAHWGLEIERRQLAVDTGTFQTSEPRIFAVGDINTYPGKRKLILCGFHEATLAGFAAAEVIRPEQKATLQYTTTSTKLHKALGVLPT